MFGRKEVSRTHRQQALDELTESYNHLKLAAAHAAEGTAERMTPTYDKAREAAVRGLAGGALGIPPRLGGIAMRRAHEEQKKRRRWPAFFGLLAAGVAVGAAGAIVSRRRRNAAQWEEFEPMPGLETGVGTEGTREKAASAVGKVAAGAASVAEGVSTKAGQMAESVRGTGSAAHEKASGKGPDIGETASGAGEARRMQAGGPESQARGETFSGFAEESRNNRG